MIITEDVKPVRFSCKCDKCGIGFMIHDDTDRKATFLTQTSPIFMHKCSNEDCDNTLNSRVSFPYIEWVGITESMSERLKE